MTGRRRPNEAPSGHRRAPVLVAGLALLAAVVFSGTGPVSADTKAERDEVRRQAAALSAQLDVLKAQDAEVLKALAALESQLVAQQAKVASADQAVISADLALTAARTQETVLTTDLDQLEASLRKVAIDSYVRRTRDTTPRLDETTTDLSEVSRQRTLTDLVAKSADDLVDELKSTQEDLGRARKEADGAATAANQRRQDAQAQLAGLSTAKAQQADFAAKLGRRIESALAESAGFAQRDAALSVQIAQEQAELLAKLRIGTGTGTPRTSTTVTLATVGGITVNAAIADQVAALLIAAARDGIALTGSGYRDPGDQQALRVAHCADPVSSPASACRPPTARPGFSMHEQGLAIDFSYNGATIGSRSNPAYRWLASNASRFGFYNLPSEAWHWSTTGD
jgi:LAS superfamily LD-carboxypeptidase LdcB